MLQKLLFISILVSSFLSHSYSQCVDHQKNLLLQLKYELIFYGTISTKLVQWNQTHDCCKWYGVECDGAGHVTSLQLDGESILGGIEDSSTLFRLTYLQKLNLAYNFFNYIPIPKGIQNLSYLTHLNLSCGNFGGQVPSEIFSLRRLISLDISCDAYYDADVYLKYKVSLFGERLKLEHPNLEMFVRNLTGLRDLYLDRVAVSSSDERRKWSHIISSYLPNIRSLSMADCSLSEPLAKSFWQLHSLSILRLDGNNLSAVAPDLFASFSNLTSLSLSGCHLQGSLTSMIFKIPTLQNLDFSSNFQLSGSLPSFPKSGSLKSMRLSLTNLSGLIPSSISNLKALSKIDLYDCQFTGSIPSTFANLTELIHVDLSHNLLTGSLSSTLFEGLSNLAYLDLGYNYFTGYVPQYLFGLPMDLFLYNNQFIGLEEFPIVNVSRIVSLYLERNQLEGPVPDVLFQLESLEYLLLSENLLNGTFQLDKIQSLDNLKIFDLSYNNVSVDVGNNNSSTYGHPQLNDLRLASCHVYDFPKFIQHSNMTTLDLSDNRIAGEIPSWIWGTQLVFLNLSFNLLTDIQKPYQIPTSLTMLDLHSNQLRGKLHLPTPLFATNLNYLLLGNNSFSGSIPTSLCSVTSLFVLDLFVNNFSGNIPPCTFNNLVGLHLGQNNISGRIPDNFPTIGCGLKYFNVNNNSLEGEFPKSIESCRSLEFINVGNNILNDTFPCMLPSTLRFLVLRSNRFHGEVRCHNSWPNLQIVDISSNNFSGNMGSISFSSWTSMMIDDDDENFINSRLSSYFVPTSYTYTAGISLTIKGHDAEIVNIWPDFTVVDFSCNNFEGEIPNAIGDFSLLYLLNLSHNALNGSIPKSFGHLKKLESLDLSQNQIVGAIPIELAGLTFLQVLNLSYNKLVGEIPYGRQLQTFTADSFIGNPGLCGFNLNVNCTNHTNDDSDLSHDNEEEKREIKWEYVSAALGYVVGLGSFVWLLVFCRSFRYKYFGKIDEVVAEMFDARDRRKRRRRARATSAVRNRVRRQ